MDIFFQNAQREVLMKRQATISKDVVEANQFLSSLMTVTKKVPGSDAGQELSAIYPIVSLTEFRGKQLKAIEAALVRIEAGDYETCLECNETIPRERLEVQPQARRCVSCSEKKSRRNSGPRRKWGSGKTHRQIPVMI